MKTNILPRDALTSLRPYAPGKPIEEVQREFGLERIVKLASNENPLGCSPLAKKAIAAEMEQTALYPEATAPALAERLAKRHGLEKGNLFLGNGSDEIIHLLTRGYVRPGDEAVMADVTFPRYETNTRIEGGVPVKVPLKDGVHDLDAMLGAMTPKTRMMFVCNPNNPTGTIVGKASFHSFIRSVPEHVLLVIDEAYAEYVTDPDYLETIGFVAERPNLVVLRTFSKIYGLAGLRIGYAAMHPSIARELAKVKDAFNTNRLAQAAALASLEDPDFVTACARYNRDCKAIAEAELHRLGLETFPSQANFLMIKLPVSGELAFRALLEQGVIVRSGEALGLANSIRVTIGTEHENELFLQSLRRFLQQKDVNR
jgi:histidinol-phosphate aminotransferase